jgi:hypothetical protein
MSNYFFCPVPIKDWKGSALFLGRMSVSRVIMAANVLRVCDVRDLEIGFA